jgi:putative PIN family toxin of toxin-antitoxin system
VRILLDSNVWLAILTTDGHCRRVWRKARSASTICASPEILAEIEEKLRVKFGFRPRHSQLLAAFVRQQCVPAQADAVPSKTCRDPDDDRILSAAVNAGCTHLVTGDKDLLALKTVSGVLILNPREFEKLVADI